MRGNEGDEMGKDGNRIIPPFGSLNLKIYEMQRDVRGTIPLKIKPLQIGIMRGNIFDLIFKTCHLRFYLRNWVT